MSVTHNKTYPFRYGFTVTPSAWNWTGVWASLRPKCLSNYRAIQKMNTQSRSFQILRDVTIRRLTAYCIEAQICIASEETFVWYIINVFCTHYKNWNPNTLVFKVQSIVVISLKRIAEEIFNLFGIEVVRDWLLLLINLLEFHFSLRANCISHATSGTIYHDVKQW